MKDTIKTIIDFFKNFFFPEKCLLCGELLDRADSLDKLFCCNCFKGITRIKPPVCSMCGEIFKTDKGGNHLCRQCIKKPRYFETAKAYGVYEKDLKELIISLKFRKKLQAAPYLEKLLFSVFIKSFDLRKTDIIAPVPLHIKRFRKRGFNQAYILIKNWSKLARQENIPDTYINIDRNLLIRTRYTKPQTGLGKLKRLQNIKGAFSVTDPLKVKTKRVILIDDVLTTGATVDECAKTLLKAGADNVCVLTLARAQKLP